MDTQMDSADKINLLLGALVKEAAACAGRAERLDQLEFERIWSKLEKTYDIKYQQVRINTVKIVRSLMLAYVS